MIYSSISCWLLNFDVCLGMSGEFCIALPSLLFLSLLGFTQELKLLAPRSCAIDRIIYVESKIGNITSMIFLLNLGAKGHTFILLDGC
jgi:hypothetical protein